MKKEILYQWSKDYGECISCKSTIRQHYAKGLCSRCYNAHRSRLSTIREYKHKKQRVPDSIKLDLQKLKTASQDFVKSKYTISMRKCNLFRKSELPKIFKTAKYSKLSELDFGEYKCILVFESIKKGKCVFFYPKKVNKHRKAMIKVSFYGESTFFYHNHMSNDCLISKCLAFVFDICSSSSFNSSFSTEGFGYFRRKDILNIVKHRSTHAGIVYVYKVDSYENPLGQRKYGENIYKIGSTSQPISKRTKGKYSGYRLRSENFVFGKYVSSLCGHSEMVAHGMFSHKRIGQKELFRLDKKDLELLKKASLRDSRDWIYEEYGTFYSFNFYSTNIGNIITKWHQLTLVEKLNFAL